VTIAMSEADCIEKTKLVIKEALADRDFIDERKGTEQEREEKIPFVLKMVQEFLSGRATAEEFRKKAQGNIPIFKLWGFTGVQGQMFFNQLVLNVPEKNRVDEELRAAIGKPKDMEEAKLKIDRFVAFVEDQRKKATNVMKQPQVGRIPFFITYWWLIQGSDLTTYWPSFVDSMTEFGCFSFDSSLPISENYSRFVEAFGALPFRTGYSEEDVEYGLFHHWRKEMKSVPIQAAPTQTQVLESAEDDELFKQIKELLNIKKQLIFYGPPGTGKTERALRFAKSLGCDFASGTLEIVQFHPSYSYEDFVIGLRPKVDNGVLTYPPTSGSFKRFCDNLRNPEKPAVFIIDEINRGNIPKIFGELIFAIEDRRERKVMLPFMEKPWSIPDNVILIGTMNTADRSIALLDVALRRRFLFMEVPPDSDKLRAYLETTGADREIVDLAPALMDEINNRLTMAIDRNHQLGHTYLMKPKLDWSRLRIIFQYEIIPLLQEFFYDDYGKIASIIGEDFFTAVTPGTRPILEIRDLSEAEFKQAVAKLAPVP
jgi:MoxR-like ATPase